MCLIRNENFSMMNFFLTLIIFIKSILSFVKECGGKYVEGHLIVSEKWYFIARFCFLSEEGQFEYFIEYSKEYAVQNLLLYYDSDYQWPSVYKTEMSCEEKESALKTEQNQIINLTESEFSSGCLLVRSTKFGGANLLSCHNVRKFRSARPRWWFLVVSHCNATNGLNLKYKFYMTNGAPGDIWREHFSADEFYILPLLCTFLVMYMILCVATVGCTVELKARQLLHSTYRMFTMSVFLQEFGILFLCIAYFRYAVDGVGFPFLKRLGRICESYSEMSFLLLLLLLAKGYTTTRGRLRLGSSVRLTIFMCLYFALTFGLFVYEEHVFDPGEVLYLYESPAGFGLMILRIVAWWIFEYSTVFTLKHHPEKSNFYYPFNLMGTLWFIAGPCLIIAANTLIDKWIRESFVCAVEHMIAFCGHILFFMLTIPNKANKNFPYHVRTSQIGIMEMTGVSGNNTIYNFGRHPYAPPFSHSPDRAHICSPNVPIDLFSIHQSTDEAFQKSSSSSNTVTENTGQSERNNRQNFNDEVNSEKSNNTSQTNLDNTSPTAVTNNGIFSVDRFIAPSQHNNRSLSA